MGVVLKFQSSGQVPGKAGPVQMQGGSLTVGRGEANDLVLPDPEKQLSKSHFVIEDHNGNVVIVDLSTNGTFLNYSRIPLGRTPTPINNGDVLSAGPYELVVEITDESAAPDPLLADPLADDVVSHGMADNAPDPLALLDDAAPGGDFLDDLLGPDKAPTGPSQLNPTDPIDELLPPMGEEEDPFFDNPSDGREGDGASFASHNPSATDAFNVPRPQQSDMIPEDWDDDLLSPASSGASSPPPQEPRPAPPPPPPPSRPAAPPPVPPQELEPFPAEEEEELPATVLPTPPRRTPPRIAEDSPFAEGTVTSSAPAKAPVTQAEAPKPQPVPAAEVPKAAPKTEPTEASEAPAAPAASGDAAMAFIEALGAEDARISDEELPRAMARMGRVMRTFITGLREILMTRTSIKSEFRIEQTMIAAGGNNPLKFSITPEQAIEAMVRPATKGYLTPESAAEQALEDIKAHEVAMVTGMEAALRGVLAKLDPQKLASQIETRGGLGSLLGGKKAKYWDVYEKLYSDISDQAENDFHDLFAKEFARAYKDQLEKLKSKV